MDYLKYVDGDSILHKLDPRTKFVFFVVMAVLTSLIKSGVALLFLFAFLSLCGVPAAFRNICWSCCQN